MIKVKLTICDDSPSTKESFLKQTPGLSGKWGDFRFYVNESVDTCDYWVVFEDLTKKDSANCPKENTIFITGEPSSMKGYNQKFLNQFSKIITSQRQIKHPSVYHMVSGHTWFPKKTYDELSGHDTVPKSKLLSIVVSNKIDMPGQKKRLEFCLALKKHFGDRVDLFGRGINDFDDKWDVLAPYKYSIAIENSVEPDYVTEKINDCFISMTFPFYYGCPNINDYCSPDSYQLIDINDFEKSCALIEEIINDDTHYARHLESLITSKNKYLNHQSTIPLIVDFIKNEYGETVSPNRGKITIKNRRQFQRSLASTLYDVKRAIKQSAIALKIC